MARHEPSLERRVFSRFVGVGTQEVADRHMSRFVVVAVGTDMQVMGPGPFVGLYEQVEVRRLGVRHEQVAEVLQQLQVASAWLEVRHGHLKVEDGLGGQPGDGSRADMFEPTRQRTESLLDAPELRVGLRRPAGVPLDEADLRVEAVVE